MNSDNEISRRCFITATGCSTGHEEAVGREWVTLVYHRELPFEVELHIGSSNVWRFARDILNDAMRKDHIAGMGDVQAWSDKNTNKLFLRLSSPDGYSTLEFMRHAVLRFVNDTRAMVPRGSETMDMDGVINQILTQGA